MTTEPGLFEDTSVLLPAVVKPGGGEVAPLAELAERAGNYARSSKAANTLRAYESDLRHFGAWCDARCLEAFPAEAETVALYLTDHTERLAVSTLRRRLAAISEGHQAARLPNPTIDPAVRLNDRIPVHVECRPLIGLLNVDYRALKAWSGHTLRVPTELMQVARDLATELGTTPNDALVRLAEEGVATRHRRARAEQLARERRDAVAQADAADAAQFPSPEALAAAMLAGRREP